MYVGTGTELCKSVFPEDEPEEELLVPEEELPDPEDELPELDEEVLEPEEDPEEELLELEDELPETDEEPPPQPLVSTNTSVTTASHLHRSMSVSIDQGGAPIGAGCHCNGERTRNGGRLQRRAKPLAHL